MAHQSFWHLIITAGPVVQLVLILLVAASIISWMFIFQRYFLFRSMRAQLENFEASFWSGISVNDYYQRIKLETPNIKGIHNLFAQGYEAFQNFSKKRMKPAYLMEHVQRAMGAAQNREQERLEAHLPFLATVGSVSPYVGLFGTVWGIMHAFSALSQVQQATISMVAPGIAEALIATAIGLFAAIPAVIAYNRFSHHLNRLLSRYENFQDEFISVLSHEIHEEQ